MLEKLFGKGSAARTAVFGMLAAVAVLAFTQLVLPGGREGNGTPPAVLFSGLITGLLNGLIAVGVVLIYRSSRIINFAQAALGAAGGVFAFNLAVVLKWPFLIAFVAGVLVAGVLGLVVDLGFIQRFFSAPRLVLTVMTIALVGFLGVASGFVDQLPIFGNIIDRDPNIVRGRAEVNFPFGDFNFEIGDVPLEFGFQHLLAISASLAAVIALGLFLRYSRTGVAIRAASENPDRALLLGINVRFLSSVVWTIAGLLSGLGVILNSSIAQQFTAGPAPPAVMLAALAAAVLARMRSVAIAVGAAVLISVLREAVAWSYQSQESLLDVGLLAVIVIGLLIQRRRIQQSEEAEAAGWKATEEHRPIPKEMLAISGIKIWRAVMVLITLTVVLLYPWVVQTRQIQLGGYVAILAIVMLSLVVLTGWAGQVSLGQFGFVAVAAVLGGAMTSRWGISFWLALPVVPILTAAFAVLVGIPALRIKGLFLGVTTFAFAFAVQSGLFSKSVFGWLLPDRVDRPTLFLVDFDDERSMYYLALAALVLATLIVTILRRSRPGRVLIGVRDNEPNVQSFGVNLVKTRLAAFALSGFLCGFAGVLLAHHQRAVAAQDFPAQISLDIFLFAVVGGVGSVAGALLGASYFALQQLFAGDEIWAFVAGPFGILAILYFAPGGLASLVFGFRDGILRIVAQRRHMIVPSLFADYDPEALTRRLIPLAEPIQNSGLAAISHDQRYRVGSYLYGERGRSAILRGRSTVSEEEVAIGAAAGAAGLGAIDDQPPPIQVEGETA